MDDYLLHLINERDKLFKKAKLTKKDEDCSKARKLRNMVKKGVNKARSDFVKSKLNAYKNDSRKFWKHLKEVFPGDTKTAKKIKLVNQQNGQLIEEDSTAEYINSFFCDVGPQLAQQFENSTWTNTLDKTQCNFHLVETTVAEVYKVINQISIFKASAVEGLSTRVLMDAFLSITDEFTFMFNLSITSGIFPDEWKVATVIPLQKDGNKEDVNNLRPISLLPFPGKLLEKLVHSQLSAYLENNTLLNDCQGGFRHGISTINKIAELTDDIYKAMDSKETTVAVFIDFKKAFDTVNHAILLSKLRHMGVRDISQHWFQSYLSNRSQLTLANGVLSSAQPVRCGVPQGSTLGPLLFLVYINDLANVITESNLHLFAADTVVYCSNKDPQRARNSVQGDLQDIAQWCCNNKITINIKKTKSVTFGTKHMLKKYDNPRIQLNDSILENVKEYKYLGITLDSTLNFNKHINNILKIVSHKLWLLSKVRQFITKAASLRIYSSMILPYFDYGDIIYQTATIDKLSKLQRLQNRAQRIVTRYDVDYKSTHEHQIELKILPLARRRHMHLLNCAFNRSSQPRYVDNRDLLTRAHDKKLLLCPKPNTELMKKSVLYNAAKHWNNLRLDEQQASHYSSFKAKSKRKEIDRMLALQQS